MVLLLTQRFDLCIGENCSECNGIDVVKINKNLYKCSHNGSVLYMSDYTTLIAITLLSEPKWLEYGTNYYNV